MQTSIFAIKTLEKVRKFQMGLIIGERCESMTSHSVIKDNFSQVQEKQQILDHSTWSTFKSNLKLKSIIHGISKLWWRRL